MKIGFIGTGNMASALINGFKIYPQDVYISNRTQEKAQALANKLSVNFCKSNDLVCKNADVIFVCVKPNMYEEVLTEVLPYIEGKIIVSIAAGITVDFIKKVTQDKCTIVRTMPNTPSMVLCGMTGICFDEKINDNERKFILDLFKGVGETLEVSEEDIHMVIGLAGSSPAYAYMFIDALAKAGENLGFDYNTAITLAANAVMGAAKMVIETGISPEILTKNVCSPGGTTIEGVGVLENDLDILMHKTVDAVVKKSKKLTK